MRMVKLFAALSVCLQSPLLFGQSDTFRRIKLEEDQRGQAYNLAKLITGTGPRLTGGKNVAAAGKIVQGLLWDWGTRIWTEEFPFARTWENTGFQARLISPDNQALIGQAIPWTAG